MAVTTGKDTGTTSTGGGSSTKSPDSGRGPGGPGGGSLSAPNRTDPSKGATASKAAPSSAPGKTDKEASAPTSAPGKIDKVGTSEGPAKKPGLAGLQGASTQAKFDKQKDLYTQAGGASVSMRNPSGQKESAKVVDPSRGPNRGLDSINTTTTKTVAGKTDNIAKQPSSNLIDKGNPQQRVAGGKTNNPAATNGSATAGPWGGAKTSTTNVAAKTDKQQSPTVSRPSNESFIDSLGVGQPGLTVSGSIMGMQPSARSPSLGQVMRQDPISSYGPRAGTTATTPTGNRTMGPSDALATIEDSVRRAQQGTLLGDYAMPQPKAITDRVPQENTPMPFKMAANPNRGLGGLNQQPAAPAAPSMPDPRMAQMREQFDRIAAARGQSTNAPVDVAAPNSVGVVPASAPPPAAPSVPTRQGQITNPMYRDPMAQAQAVRSAVALGLGGIPQQVAPQSPAAPTRQPMEINIPGYPARVAPSQEGEYDLGAQGGLGVQAYRSDVASPPLNVPGNSTGQQRDTYYGGGPTPSVHSGAESIFPSQDGSYPPDDNFMQDDGQPQSLGELSNRYDYEKGLVKQGLKEIPGRLWSAITQGDIRGFTPETNDKRGVNPPSMNKRLPQQAPMSDADTVMVARLLALIKEIEQQGGSQAQADLVNSTFI